MNASQLTRALQKENNHLRKHIQDMDDANKQADFIERLTCAALTGAVASGKSPQEAAEFANEVAHKTLTEFIRRVVQANEQIINDSDKQMEQVAGSVEQTIEASQKFQAQQAAKGDGKRVELIL